MLAKQTYSSPLGDIFLVSNGQALVGAWFSGQKYFGAGFELSEIKTNEDQILVAAKNWLDAYFAGKFLSITFPLEPQVTSFRKQVLTNLQQVSAGKTTTYQELAKELGSHARAVGGAVAHNPLVIFIPCHRVLAKDGSLNGYAGGLVRKEKLLQLERKN